MLTYQIQPPKPKRPSCSRVEVVLFAIIQQVFRLTLTRSIGGKMLWIARARMDLAVPLLPEMRTPPMAGFTVSTNRRIYRLRAGISKNAASGEKGDEGSGMSCVL